MRLVTQMVSLVFLHLLHLYLQGNLLTWILTGNENVAGSGNTINFERGLKDSVTGILGSITNPSAGNGNTITNNGNGNGKSRLYVHASLDFHSMAAFTIPTFRLDLTPSTYFYKFWRRAN